MPQRKSPSGKVNSSLIENVDSIEEARDLRYKPRCIHVAGLGFYVLTSNYWNPDAVANPDNNGTVIVLSNDETGDAYLLEVQQDSWVSPLWFGASQTNVNEDASPYIQACVEYCKNHSWVKRIQIPPNVHIQTSIDLTPASAPPGLIIRGYGKNSIVYADCAGFPTFDCTGNTNQTFETLGLRSLEDEDSSSLSSVHFLCARDSTNASAGGHTIKDCATLHRCKLGHVVGISSETFTIENSTFTNTQPGTRTCHFGAQNDLGVTSAYAEFPETWTGGNTVHRVINSVIQAPGGAGGFGLSYVSAQDICVIATHQNGGGDAGMLLDGCTAINISGGSSEWGLLSPATHGLRLDGDINGLCIHGFTSTTDLYGSDGSTATKLSLTGSRFVSGVSLYDVADSPTLATDINGNGLTIRRISTFTDVCSSGTPDSSDLTLTVPTSHYGLTHNFKKLGSDGVRRYFKYLYALVKDRIVVHGIFASYFGTKIQTIAGTGSIDINPDLGSTCYSLLTGNVAISANLLGSWVPAVAEEIPSIDMTFTFKQDAVGGHTVSWGGIWNPAGWTVNTTANAVSSITFRFYPGGLYFVRHSGY